MVMYLLLHVCHSCTLASQPPQHARDARSCLAGGCKLLLQHFRPSVALEDQDRDDGHKLVSEIFKIKANDLLDLYLNYDFTIDMIEQVVRLDLEDL